MSDFWVGLCSLHKFVSLTCRFYISAIIIIIIIIIIQYARLLSQAFLPGTSLELAVIPTIIRNSYFHFVFHGTKMTNQQTSQHLDKKCTAWASFM